MGKLDKDSLAGKIFSGVAVFAFAFFASYLSSSHFAPVSKSEAVSGTGASTSTYYADISSSGSIDITLQSTPDGVYKVGKDSLSINTNSTVGYKLYISTEDKSSISLDSSIPANGLIDSATGAYISPSSGTVDTPVRLGTNTWGYTVSRSSSEASTSYVDSDAAPTEAKGGKSVWRAVPEYGNEDIFYVNSAPATASTNSVDVYYAVNASTALPSGTYSNTVVYTAIVEGNAPDSTSEFMITPAEQDYLAAGNKITINTGIYSDLTLEELVNANYPVNVKIGDNTCTDISVTKDSTNGNLIITCTAPAQTSYGSYNVAIEVTKYHKIFTLENAYSYTIPKFYTITKMQEMTHEICANTEVVTPAANATLALTKDNFRDTNGNLQAGIPTRTLLDDRAGQVSYTVKKLADGKCWMTENLALPSGSVLTAADSDLDGVVVTSYTVPASSATFTASQDNDQMNSQYTNTTDDPRGYKTGNYYSWRSATAGTGRGSTTDGGAAADVFGTNMNTQGNNTLVSICPKGWRLPTSGSGNGTTGITIPGNVTNLENGDFQALYVAYGGENDSNYYAYMTDTGYGPNLSLSGAINNGGRLYEGSLGIFWSSTTYNSQYAHRLNLNASKARPQDSNNKYVGLIVRCIAR